MLPSRKASFVLRVLLVLVLCRILRRGAVQDEGKGGERVSSASRRLPSSVEESRSLSRHRRAATSSLRA